MKQMPAIIDRFHYCQTSTGFFRKLCSKEWKFSYKNTNYYLHPNTVFAHSTEHAILDMVESIRTNMDKRLFSCGVFIDLKKAFDTVDHKILLDKLNYYGLRGIDNQWFSSYFTNRTQTTEINSFISDKEVVSCGVPQGSVSGPLLFLLYVNDIQYCSRKLKFFLFADDTNILLLSRKSQDIGINCKYWIEQPIQLANRK